MFRILSLDGGGICGLITLEIIRRIQTAFPDFIDKCDLIAGTSTGGIMALLLAHGVSVENIIHLYYNSGPDIFDPLRWSFGGYSRCKYKNDKLKSILEDQFGNTKLGDLKCPVFVPTFELDNKDIDKRRWKPKFYSSLHENDIDKYQLAKNVALYTSAAPTYFPIANNHIDGGIMANNPAVFAVFEAVSCGHSLFDISVISISTGEVLRWLDVKDGATWGIIEWMPELVDAMLDSNIDLSTFGCTKLLNDRFLRIDPETPKAFKLDDWKARDTLLSVAEQYDLNDSIHWLHSHWKDNITPE